MTFADEFIKIKTKKHLDKLHDKLFNTNPLFSSHEVINLVAKKLANKDLKIRKLKERIDELEDKLNKTFCGKEGTSLSDDR